VTKVFAPSYSSILTITYLLNTGISLTDIEGADADTSLESIDTVPDIQSPFHPWLHRDRHSERTTHPLFSDGTELLGVIGRGTRGQHVAIGGRGRGNIQRGNHAAIRGRGLGGSNGPGRGQGATISTRGAAMTQSYQARAHHHVAARGAGVRGNHGRGVMVPMPSRGSFTIRGHRGNNTGRGASRGLGRGSGGNAGRGRGGGN
jgi:hypothetical protein